MLRSCFLKMIHTTLFICPGGLLVFAQAQYMQCTRITQLTRRDSASIRVWNGILLRVSLCHAYVLWVLTVVESRRTGIHRVGDRWIVKILANQRHFCYCIVLAYALEMLGICCANSRRMLSERRGEEKWLWWLFYCWCYGYVRHMLMLSLRVASTVTWKVGFIILSVYAVHMSCLSTRYAHITSIPHETNKDEDGKKILKIA